MLSIKRSATCSTRGGSQEMYITFASAMWIRQNPLWLWNPEETSPEIQNRGTSGPKIGHVNVSDKKTGKKILESLCWIIHTRSTCKFKADHKYNSRNIFPGQRNWQLIDKHFAFYKDCIHKPTEVLYTTQRVLIIMASFSVEDLASMGTFPYAIERESSFNVDLF